MNLDDEFVIQIIYNTALGNEIPVHAEKITYLKLLYKFNELLKIED